MVEAGCLACRKALSRGGGGLPFMQNQKWKAGTCCASHIGTENSMSTPASSPFLGLFGAFL